MVYTTFWLRDMPKSSIDQYGLIQGKDLYKLTPKVTFTDVLLTPRISAISSRSATDIAVQFGPFDLKIPLISAPMDTITGETMIRKLAELGAIGTLPRGDLQERYKICEKLSKDNVPCVYAVGVKERDTDAVTVAKELKKRGAQAVLLDIAHGGMLSVLEVARKIKKETGLFLLCGNIADAEQAKEYASKKWGIDAVRVGVGPGGLCSTRVQTGIGYPQLAAISETSVILKKAEIQVIADGGIREPGDVVKALAAGADIVMIGSFFAGTEETPGEIINGKKMARGQASKAYMKDNGIMTGEHRTAEGVAVEVIARGSVMHSVYDITGGLRSAMSYIGAKSLKELQTRARFVQVSPATRFESIPHLSVKSIA